MNKNLLVQIFVPTDTEDGFIATGYPVAKDRILTAGHVMLEGGRDETRPMEVRWYHQPEGEARQWRKVQGIVWDGGEKCDAAVLAVDFPAGIRADALLSNSMPVTGVNWESEGFAHVGKRTERREPVPLKGAVYSMADTDCTFDLGVDDPTSLPGGWRGASGSPVFVSGAILGVVVTCPPDFDNRRLRATPVWRLFQQQTFCDAIGIDAREARLDAYRKAIANLLDQIPDVLEILGRRLAGVSSCVAEDRPNALQTATAFTRLQPQKALELLDDVHREYSQTGKVKTARTVKEIALWALPAVFDEGVVEGVRLRRSNLKGALIELPVGTRTVAEIVMAGFDRRSVRYRQPVGGQELDAVLRLPHVPEVGIDRDCRRFQEAFQTNLTQLLLAGDVKSLHDAFHDYITGMPEFVSDTQRGRSLSKDTLIKLAAGKLRHKSQRQQTYYFVFELPPENQPAVRQHFRAVLDDLKRQYESIVFLNLSRDGELIVREHSELVYPLTDLHTRDQV